MALNIRKTSSLSGRDLRLLLLRTAIDPVVSTFSNTVSQYFSYSGIELRLAAH
jgi:hypothetical protein